MDTARYVEKITALFGRILAETQPDPEAEELGLTSAQLQGLAYLFHHGESSVGDLAHGLGTTHPAAVKLVDRLQKKELVLRTSSQSDRRVSLVAVTDKGREMANRVLASRTSVLERAISTMDQAELEGLMRGLESLLSGALENRSAKDSLCLRCGDDHFGCCVVNLAHLEHTGSTIKGY
jgi:DNA-binding MarR family transcriptional regulator